MADIRKLWELYKEDSEASDDDLGSWPEYGLCFDYVPAGTFDGQKRGYFRFQISTGGPGEEIRFFCDERFNPTRIEFVLLDWYDGATVQIQRDSANDKTLREIWADWMECEVPQEAMKRAAE